MAGAGRRLVLEAIFLVGLAVAAGLAEFSTEEIIEVMALGWLVTVLIELIAWRLAMRRPAVEERTVAQAPPAPVAAPPAPQEVAPEPEPEVVAQVEPEPGAGPAVAEAEPEPDAEPAVAQAEPEPVVEPALVEPEPVAADESRPADPKRGGLFGWRRRADPPEETTDETPPAPRHVRVIERTHGVADPDPEDTAGELEVPPAERAGGA